MNDTPVNIPDAIPTLEADIPAEALAGPGMLWYVLGGMALLLLAAAVALLLWWRLHKRPAVLGPSPLQRAMEELAALEEELPPLRPCALRLSLLLRSYLAGRAQDPALFETQEEFNQRMDALATLPVALRPATRELLEDLAAYKYAGETASDSTQSRALIERSRELLQQLDDAQQAAEAAAARGEEDEDA